MLVDVNTGINLMGHEVQSPSMAALMSQDDLNKYQNMFDCVLDNCDDQTIGCLSNVHRVFEAHELFKDGGDLASGFLDADIKRTFSGVIGLTSEFLEQALPDRPANISQLDAEVLNNGNDNAMEEEDVLRHALSPRMN